MQSGVLTAANTSSSSFVSYRIYEQVKCYTPAGDVALWFMYQPMLMNKSAYEALNDKQRAALDAAAAKAEADGGGHDADEDAMRVAADLNGYGIKVGEGESCAKYRFADTDAVWDWLRRLVNEHA